MGSINYLPILEFAAIILHANMHSSLSHPPQKLLLTLNFRGLQRTQLFSACQPKLLLIKVALVVLFSQADQPSILRLTAVQRQQGAPGFQVPAIMMALYCL